METALQNTETTSKVRLISQEEVRARALPQSLQTPQPEPDLPRSRSDFQTQVLATMTALMGTIGSLLAARLIMLLSTMGAFVLAYLTIQNPDPMRLAACLVYDIFVMGPLVYLTIRKA